MAGMALVVPASEDSTFCLDVLVWCVYALLCLCLSFIFFLWFIITCLSKHRWSSTQSWRARADHGLIRSVDDHRIDRWHRTLLGEETSRPNVSIRWSWWGQKFLNDYIAAHLEWGCVAQHPQKVSRQHTGRSGNKDEAIRLPRCE